MATAKILPPRQTLDPHITTGKLQHYIKLEEVQPTPEISKREWQAKLKDCFHHEESFSDVLRHLEEVDAELSDLLENQTMESSSTQPPSFMEEYQECVDAFISLFAQSRLSAKRDRHDIVESLLKYKCPQMGLFRRLAIDPTHLGTDNPDSLEKLTVETGSYPTSQLARVCDVAVLRFLSSVTVKTEPQAIVWALNYLTEMIQQLDMSLRAQSEAGWCGVHFRKRKDTIRRSVIEPPKLAVDGTPVVVGILKSSAPSETSLSPSVNPETGQSSHHTVPSITIDEEGGGSSKPDAIGKTRTRRSSRDESSVSQALAAVALVHKQPPPTAPNDLDLPAGGRRRRHSVTTPQVPTVVQLPTSSLVEPPKRRSSTGSRPSGLVAPPPVRKSSSNISSINPLAGFATITEEENVDSTLPRPEKSTDIPEDRKPKLVHPLDDVISGRPPAFSSLDFDTSPSPSPTTLSPLPSYPSSPTLFSIRSPSPTSSASSTSPRHHTAIPRAKSSSQMVSSLLESRRSPPREPPFDAKSLSDSEPEVKQKESTRPLSPSTSPSHMPVNKLTPEILKLELRSFVNYEGRISLLGILASISSLPTELKLWTDNSWDSCRKCFSLIQFCMDFGLETPQPGTDNEAINRRRLFQPRDGQSLTNLDFEKPSKTYTRLVLQNALNALIQCAVSMYNGCSSDNCPLGPYTRGASQNLHKMMHQLERLYSNSSFIFREAVKNFAQTSPCKKVFHFLHVILQYCPKGDSNDPLDPSSCRRDPLISLTAVVLRIMVDRLTGFDLSEPTIQEGIVKEAIAFFRYAIALFNQDFLQVKASQHLHHYVQRVALSVLLPIRAPPLSPPSTPSIVVEAVPDIGTFPRKKEKRELTEIGFRRRGQTMHGDPTQGPSNQGKSPRTKRAPLVKQTSIHKEPQAPPRNSTHNAAMALLQEEWKGLRVGVLRARIRRLHLLLEFNEPGKMLEPGVLASLVTVGPVGSVVPRALVLLECALFVKKLSEGHKTHWLQDQLNESDLCRYQLLVMLKKWAEAIGESIRNAELMEKNLLLQADSAQHGLEEPSATELDPSQGSPSPDQVVEEPVLPAPDEERDPEKKYIVSYAIKMAACMLLLEITKLIREPPPEFISSVPNTMSNPIIQVSSASTPMASLDRKVSNLSILSTDSDSSHLAVSPSLAGVPPVRRLSSEQHIRASSGFGLEDIPKFHSVDQQPVSSLGHDQQQSSHHIRKLSVYLRVNSRHGRPSRAPHPPTFSKSSETTSDLHRLASPNQSPVKSTRRMSMSVAALKQASVGVHDTTSGISRRLPRRSVAITAQPSFRRRVSVAGNYNIHDHAQKEMSPNPGVHPHTYSRQGSMTGAGKGIGSPSPRVHRQSVFNRVARKLAFRGKGKQDLAERKKLSTATLGSSTGSNTNSPSLSHRRHIKHHSSMHMESLSDLQTKLSWLDVVEHLTAAASSPIPSVNAQRKRACHDLISALEKIYEGGMEPQSRSSKESSSTGSPVKGATALPRNSISTAFSDMTYSLSLETRPLPSSVTQSVTSSFRRPVDFHRALASLNFSGARLTTFLVPGNDNVDLTVDELLEQDSAQDSQKIQNEHNRERLNYILHDYSGLLHAPFSLLTYTAPLLSLEDFAELKEFAWEMLLDPDRELADAAASFFLLACVKVKDSKDMETFFSGKDRRADSEAGKDVITRFKVLWRNRDLVWSRMEEYPQKFFIPAEDESDIIGYSVPSQPLGSLGQSLPFPPWQPSSVCTMLGCKGTSLKCYKGTSLAPSSHLHDITQMVHDFHVSAINIVHETGQDSGGTNVLAIIDEQGNFSITERLKSTVFPNSLLPLICIVIRSLSPDPVTASTISTDTPEASLTNGQSILRVSDAAEQALWTCMVDNPQHLFVPLLDQFNTIYRLTKESKKTEAERILEGVLKPLHTLLMHFPTLPPRAAHFLLNNFAGIVMRYTEQPVSLSATVIQSVLGLLKMVVSSVQGLSMRKIKDELKKQSCYTTVLSTARIRGAEKIKVIKSDMGNQETFFMDIEDPDMNFGLLMTKAIGIDDWSTVIREYCFKDMKTNLPVLSSLIVQDHYPAPSDGSLPTFVLQKATSDKDNWQEQAQMLLTHKMSEIARVLFSCEMLCCTQDKRALMESKFSQPNHHFIYNELLGHSSFPRKALYSLPYELGAVMLKHWDLRAADIMLRGVWTKFVLQLFRELEGSYQVTESVVVFITLLTGSLLLHCEDHVTLRNSLAALLTAAFKFGSIFKTSGYQMVVPSLVQVYTIHSRNKLVKESIKFIWYHFYWLNHNVFLLQAVASIANLLSSEADNLSTLLGINYSPLNTGGGGEEKHHLVATTMELMETLECGNYRHLPKDTLDILGLCPEKIYKQFHSLGHDQWVPCKLESMLSLCVVVASHAPVVLRGMQVLVFLDSIMPLVTKRFDDPEKVQALMAITRSLIKGCDSIKKHQGAKGGGAHAQSRSRRGDAVGGADIEGFPTAYAAQEHQHLSMVFRRLAFMRRRLGTSQDLSVSRNQSVAELPPLEQLNKITDGFRSRRQYDVNQKILTQAQQSVLSIASVVISHVATVIQPSGRRPVLDVHSLQTLSSVANQFLRLGAKTCCEDVHLIERVGRFMTNLLPNIEWTAENASSFTSIFERVVKIFKKMQGDTNKLVKNPDVWQWLTCSITSITLCLSRYPSVLIANNEPKIKNLLDILLAVKQPAMLSASQSGGVKTKIISSQQLIHLANFNFTEAVVELLSELINITQSLQSSRKLRIHMSALFSGKLNFKDHESEFVWRRLFLPLVIKIGLRDVECQKKISMEDVDFLLQTIHLVAEHIGVIIMYRSTSHNQQINRFFKVLRVLLSALGECFSLEHWLSISYEILALASKFDASATLRNTATMVVNNEMYVGFCLVFLKFVEDFLFISRVPLFTTIWPGIYIIERRLKSSQHSFMVLNNPSLSSLVNRSLEKCAMIKRRSSLISPVISKQELLCRFSQEYLPLAERAILPKNYSCTDSLSGLVTPSAVMAPISSLSAAPCPPPPPEPQPQQQISSSLPPPPTRRRSSYSRPPTFPAIQEKEEEADGALSGVSPDGREEKGSFAHPARPTTLNLIPKPPSQPVEAKAKYFAIRNMGGARRPQAIKLTAMKKAASPPRAHPPVRKKPARGSRLLHQFTESSFDADDEEATTQSPMQSQHPPNVWSVSQTGGESSPRLSKRGALGATAGVGEVSEMKVHVLAEVHQQPRQFALQETCLQESLPDPLNSNHTTVSPHVALTTSASLPATSQSPSSVPKRPRPKLKRAEVIDMDEVTGQLREDVLPSCGLPDLQESATLPLEAAKKLYKKSLKDSSFSSPSQPNPESEGEDDGDYV